MKQRKPHFYGSGYSIIVRYDEHGRPIIKVETFGDIDAEALRREILSRYPNAKIEGLKNKPQIRFVDEEEKQKSREKKWYKIKVE